MSETQKIRLDKWLWAARFYKTRSSAAAAITNGRVKVNGARVKSSKQLYLEDRVNIQQNPYSWEIYVKLLSARRVSAQLAKNYYEESPDSFEKRTQISTQLKLERELHTVDSKQRPSKRERSKIIRLKQNKDP